MPTTTCAGQPWVEVQCTAVRKLKVGGSADLAQLEILFVVGIMKMSLLLSLWYKGEGHSHWQRHCAFFTDIVILISN